MRRLGHAVLAAGLVAFALWPTRERAGIRGSASSPGYVLFSPLLSGTTYLIDMSGRVVHTWRSEFAPGASVHLLDNGHLLRPARDPRLPFFTGGGQGGRIQEFTWDGDLVWDFVVATRERMPHHDVAAMPNGNVLAIVWERKTAEEARSAGRRPERVGDEGLWPDAILEIARRPPSGGEIVWEWHVWDHLVQEQDPAQPDYGKVADHPELVDVNAGPPRRASPTRPWSASGPSATSSAARRRRMPVRTSSTRTRSRTTPRSTRSPSVSPG